MFGKENFTKITRAENYKFIDLVAVMEIILRKQRNRVPDHYEMDEFHGNHSNFPGETKHDSGWTKTC